MNNAFDELIVAWTWLRESAWRYVNRNFQNWKAKRKNERKETKTTEYPRTVDNYKGVPYAQWEYQKAKKEKRNSRNIWSTNDQEFFKINDKTEPQLQEA